MAVVFNVKNPRQENYNEDYDYLLGKITALAQTVAQLQSTVATLQQQNARLLTAQNVTVPTQGGMG